MNTSRKQNFLAVVLVCAMAFISTISYAADPLPSWNDGKAKQSIVEFVAKVTKEGSPDYMSAAERIAVFDNDGTLWAEQPMYFQFLCALAAPTIASAADAPRRPTSTWAFSRRNRTT